MSHELLVLAAGMGSRYGGLKQIDPVGLHGEAIIDYSVFDAIKAGFSRLIFVIRRDIEDDFRKAVGRHFEKRIDVDYVFQELDDITEGFSIPDGREKPWGTAHAIRAARDAVRAPFCVINSDDFYGAHSFTELSGFLQGADPATCGFAMVAFILRNTLSPHGSVSRGVCVTDGSGLLESVSEYTEIAIEGTGARARSESGNVKALTGDEIVSMNMFGFTPAIFPHLEAAFANFMSEHGTELKSEFFIPSVVNDLIVKGTASVRVLPTDSSWFGITFREDREYVVEKIRERIQRGDYPEKLWE